MNKRDLLAAGLAAAVLTPLGVRAQARDTFKIGMILPMTGPFASTGRQVDAAVKLYMAQHGSTVAGQKIEVVLRDDAGVADTARRLAQELVTQEKVAVLAGFGLTPCLLAVGPVATQAKVPALVMAAASAVILTASPYVIRSSYLVPMTSVVMADWASKNKMKKVVTMVTDFAPGQEAEKVFTDQFRLNGGDVSAQIRVPITTTDYSPYLQRVRDASPDAVYIFVPSGPSATVMKQFKERGLDAAGIKIIGDGGITDDDNLNDIGDVAIGVVTAHHYSAAHPSAMNKKFVDAFRAANPNMRPNFMAVGGYDGMELIYRALGDTKGQARSDALLAAMKGQTFESPRGPLLINSQTRDAEHNIYVRKVERKDGQLYNIETDTYSAVKVPSVK